MFYCFSPLPIIGVHPCSVDNGGCQWLCVSSTINNQLVGVCKCPVGFLLLEDGWSCKECKLFIACNFEGIDSNNNNRCACVHFLFS